MPEFFYWIGLKYFGDALHFVFATGADKYLILPWTGKEANWLGEQSYLFEAFLDFISSFFSL